MRRAAERHAQRRGRGLDAVGQPLQRADVRKGVQPGGREVGQLLAVCFFWRGRFWGWWF
jgi:hypothetical protein